MKNFTKISFEVPTKNLCIYWDTSGLPQCRHIIRVKSGEYRCGIFDKALFCNFDVGVHKCEECKQLLEWEETNILKKLLMEKVE